MKTANRVLAILMAMLMAVSTFAVAASAAGGSLQAKIDAASANSTVSISANTKESVTISKNLTLDLGGKILKSVEDQPAITVTNGAQVTITNGYVESYCKNYNGGMEAVKTLTKITVSAIVAYGQGTKVILDDVRAMGGLFRVPSMTDYYVPLGSALKLYNGAEAELNNAVLMGSYAVSNDPRGLGRADGKVTVKDAILIGFIDYIKRAYNGIEYDDATVEMVNAADRIVGFLNDGITLTEGEEKLLDKALDDRIYIFTTKPTDENAIVTIDKNTGFAKITAEEITTEMGKTTDCCYKYVPEYAYAVETNEKFALNENILASKLEDKTIRIKYRLYFELKGDIKKYVNNFDAYYRRAYELAVEMADAGLSRALNLYESKIQELADVYSTLDEAAAKTITIDGHTYSAASELGDDFYAIVRGLLDLGGIKLYNKSAASEETFTTAKFEGAIYQNGDLAPQEGTYEINEANATPYYAEDEDGNPILDPETYEPILAGYYYEVTSLGTLDRADALLNGLLAAKGETFGDQEKWDDVAQYIVNHYDEIFDFIDELVYEPTSANDTKPEGKLIAFKKTLTTGTVGSIVETLGLKSKLNMLDSLIKAIKEAKKGLDTALDHPYVTEYRSKVDDLKTADDSIINPTIAEYVGKAKRAINDYTVYFTPEDFILDGKFGKTYQVDGPTIKKIIEIGKLNVVNAGSGTVAFVTDAGDTGVCNAVTDYDTVAYGEYVTLTAQPAEGSEFLYWLNTDTDRILSTDKVYKVNTQVKLYVRAVFEAVGNSKVVLTNNSGVLVDTKPYNGESLSLSGVDAPALSGYNQTGWGPNGQTETLSNDDFTSAYASGNSAFSNGAYYNSKGYGFKINSTTENKYLVTAKYDAKSSYTVTFVDPQAQGEPKVYTGVKYGYRTPYVTAAGADFSYWQDQDGNVVSVYAKYRVTATRDVTLTAVYGDAKGYGLNITSCDDTGADRISFIAERSVAKSYTAKSQGFIYSCDAEITEPKMADVDANELVYKTYSTNNPYEGVAALNVDRSLMVDGVVNVVYYVEIATADGTDYLYSAPYTYPSN